jgi:cell division protein FtsB
MTGRQDDPRDSADAPAGGAVDSFEPGPSVFERGRDLAGLSVAGITRRRIAILLAALLSAWVVLALSRQVGEARDAANQANDLSRANQALSAQIATLTEERTLVQQQAYIEIEARARGLGGRQEHPFSLSADAPALPADAPGSASAALGATPTRTAPIDAWFALLFGSGN